MAKQIRKLFHEVTNWHNKITTCAGVTKLELKDTRQNKEIKKTIRRFTRIERYAIEADRALNKLKGIIYDIIDSDTGKPR
jgi:23S rRNA C2498 (ribose-2'-O)-methylase RlmM